MRTRVPLCICAVVASVAVWQLSSPAAYADGSASTVQVQYLIHEVPTDPNSSVAFCVTLSLEEMDSDGNTIGWDIASIEILQVGDPNNMIWTEEDPSVPTEDGLWWVEHADPEDPQAEEFTMPPYLQGTADAEYAEDPDLQYKFEGRSYTPPAPPQQAPYITTGAADWQFVVVGDEEPTDEGEDEPVEVPPIDDPWGDA